MKCIRVDDIRTAAETCRETTDAFIELIDSMPVIDVPGEHENEAYWIHAKGKNNVWYCSACGEKILYNPTRRTYRPISKPDVSYINKFCRRCGKEMTGSVRYADNYNAPVPKEVTHGEDCQY